MNCSGQHSERYDEPTTLYYSCEKDLYINCCRISKEQIKRAIKKRKLGRAPGKDNIPPDVLKQTSMPPQISSMGS
jgi:hypothetical protein